MPARLASVEKTPTVSLFQKNRRWLKTPSLKMIPYGTNLSSMVKTKSNALLGITQNRSMKSTNTKLNTSKKSTKSNTGRESSKSKRLAKNMVLVESKVLVMSNEDDAASASPVHLAKKNEIMLLPEMLELVEVSFDKKALLDMNLIENLKSSESTKLNTKSMPSTKSKGPDGSNEEVVVSTPVNWLLEEKQSQFSAESAVSSLMMAFLLLDKQREQQMPITREVLLAADNDQMLQSDSDSSSQENVYIGDESYSTEEGIVAHCCGMDVFGCFWGCRKRYEY
jgi:hypothetical protein